MFGVHWWDKGSGKIFIPFLPIISTKQWIWEKTRKATPPQPPHRCLHHNQLCFFTAILLPSPVEPQALFPQIVFLLCSPFLSFLNLNFLKKICVLFSPSNRKLKIKFRFSLNMWVNLDGPLFLEQKWPVWSLGPWAGPGLTDGEKKDGHLVHGPALDSRIYGEKKDLIIQLGKNQKSLVFSVD